MAQVLEGIRVLDFTQGMAGPLATMILADYGAEVIRVEPKGGDPWWDHPAYLLWNRGKKSIDLDLDTAPGKATVRKLVPGLDVLIEAFRPGEADQLGIGYKEMSVLNPSLVYLSLSAFGQEGPYRNLKAYDGLINAKSGRMRDLQGWHGDRPIFRAINDTSYHTAMSAVQSILAGLRVVSVTGRGQRIETSLLKGVTAPNNPWARFEGQPLPPDRYPSRGNENISGLCAECKDGRWIMHSPTQVEFFRAWVNVIGFDWIWDDPRFNGAPSSFPTDGDKAELIRLVTARMKEKSSDEWIQLYTENGEVVGETMRTTQEALRHPQFIHNGHLVEIDDPRVGRVKQVGAFAKLSETPAIIKRPAPFPGQHTQEVVDAAYPPKPAIKPSGKEPRLPLEGITVIELAGWLATPFGGAVLSDLGARLIKIEPITGDPFRGMPQNENMWRAMQGKESVAINLRTKEGQEILHRLVKGADALVQNYRPSAPPRLGLDYETLRKVNPDLVYVYAGSYGSTGPNAHRPAFNPTMGAMSGNSVFQSGEGNTPAGDQSPDPISGNGVATGTILGLAAKWRTGKGQYLETTMFNSCVYCNSDDALDYAGKPPRRNPDQLQLGLEATYRLYETGEGWVFLAAPQDGEFQLFCATVGREDLSNDPRFATAAKRYENRVALGEILEPLFKTLTADEWESRLTAADVGCVKADGLGHKHFLHEDPHAEAVNFMVPTEHHQLGKYWRHGPMTAFSETPTQAGGFCGLGEHTRHVMRELGYTEAEIAKLREDEIIVWPAESGQPLVAQVN